MAKNTTRNIGFLFLLIAIILTTVFTIIQNNLNQPKKTITSTSRIKKTPAIRINYPLKNTILPVDMASPTFKWFSNITSDYFKIELISETRSIHSAFVNQSFWRPDSVLWERTKSEITNNQLEFIVGFSLNTDTISYEVFDTIKLEISNDSVIAPIFFRHLDLPLSYATSRLSSIEWCIGNLSHYKPAKVLMTGSNTCGNCHSFSSDGKTMGIDFDYQQDKGGYAIFPIKSTTEINKQHFYSWNTLSDNNKKSTGLLSAVSPCGRYVASTVNDQSINWFKDAVFRFYPIKGMIGVYDNQTGKSFLLPGASDTAYVQCNPTWSPDGKNIIFAKAKTLHESILNSAEKKTPYIKGEEDFKYNLWQIPFNNGKGGIPTPIKGASNNGKSNYFPKISPNGKWIVFCQAHSYMLRQIDSKLAIIPFGGGDARLLECNTSKLNSWHSWSPNSRWLIFSTKGANPYTKIALTHINENGHASAPLIIENMADEKRAANIPEFVNTSYENWDNVVLNFNKPTILNDIMLDTIPNGEYAGIHTTTGKHLKPLTINLNVIISNKQIQNIKITKADFPESMVQETINNILKNQTINPNIIQPNTAEEKSVLFAIADALN